MNSKPLLPQLTIIVIIMSLSSVFSFFGCNSNETLNYPPFSIKKKRVVDRQFRINEGIFSKNTYTKYQIFYRDELISFPRLIEQYGIWKTYYLKDAPIPTIIVVSNKVFLVNEENNAAKISSIQSSSNPPGLQWLDSQDGQPGSEMDMLVSEDKTDCILDGGQFLLVSQNVVLRVEDLSVFYINKELDSIDDYYLRNAIAFSPDKNEIVFMGGKMDENTEYDYKYAVVVYSYKNNKAYTLPFDKTETRVRDPEGVGTDWVNTYFEWKQNETGKYILSKKNLNPLPNWEGYFAENLDYKLNPVKEDMHLVFFNFTKAFLQLKESDISTEESENKIQYLINHKGFIFYIDYSERLNTESLSISFRNKGPEDEAKSIIKKVGDAFNDVLRNGEHQALFTNF